MAEHIVVTWLWCLDVGTKSARNTIYHLKVLLKYSSDVRGPEERVLTSRFAGEFVNTVSSSHRMEFAMIRCPIIDGCMVRIQPSGRTLNSNVLLSRDRLVSILSRPMNTKYVLAPFLFGFHHILFR